jgi:hypothetical protein
VHKLMMTSEERRTATRHRAVPSVAHRTATTVAVGTAGVLAAAVLGWFSAGAAGLTASAGDAPAAVLVPEEGASETDWAEPAMRRTHDLTVPPPAPVEQPAAGTPTTEVRPPSSVPRPSAPVPEPEPSRPPERAADPTVRQGARCPAEGDTGVTRSGDAVVCTVSRGNGKPRWRHA